MAEHFHMCCRTVPSTREVKTPLKNMSNSLGIMLNITFNSMHQVSIHSYIDADLKVYQSKLADKLHLPSPACCRLWHTTVLH